jgi:uncharacterized protein (TIGR03435 family)
MQSELNEPSPAIWAQLEPLLDEAMASLGETDRAVLALRYFENQTAAEIGRTLKLNEEAAKKRVSRALEKLRKFFTKRGVRSTAEIIAGAISANSVQTAPALLAKSVTAVAMAKGATASVSTLTLIKGALKIMARTKMKTAVFIGAGLLLAAGTTTITVKEVQAHHRYSWQLPKASVDLIRNTAPQVVIVPTIYDQDGGICSVYGRVGGAMGICQNVTNLIYYASYAAVPRIIISAGLPEGRYDFFVKLPDTNRTRWETALQEELKSELGIVGESEMRDTDVLLLKSRNPNAGGLKPPDSLRRSMNLPANIRGTGGTNSIAYFLSPISSLQDWLQAVLQIPIIDQTGIKGRYDFKLTWDNSDQTQFKENIKQSLLDQFGLELVSTNMPVQMLVIKKVK